MPREVLVNQLMKVVEVPVWRDCCMGTFSCLDLMGVSGGVGVRITLSVSTSVESWFCCFPMSVVPSSA